MQKNLRLALVTVAACIGGAIVGVVLTGGFNGAQALAGSEVAQAVSPAQRAAFEQVIRDYLANNPQVIVEAQQAFQAKQEAEQAALARQALRGQREALEKDASAPVAGNPGGDVTIVEFFDYACGYCKRALSTLEAVKAADPQVRVVYKELPILGPGSLVAARAALAAELQGKYQAFHLAMMASRQIDAAGVHAAAKSAGLDVARLAKDMEAPEIMQALDRNQLLASAIGVRGTPAFVIGEQLAPGAVGPDTLMAMVAQERERKKQVAVPGTASK